MGTGKKARKTKWDGRENALKTKDKNGKGQKNAQITKGKKG